MPLPAYVLVTWLSVSFLALVLQWHMQRKNGGKPVARAVITRVTLGVSLVITLFMIYQVFILASLAQ